MKDDLFLEDQFRMNRRHFFKAGALGVGTLALSNLFGCSTEKEAGDQLINALKPNLPHFAPKAKRVIYLFQSGGPSQLELFDHKPLLQTRNGEELPPSIRGEQRLTGMTSDQTSFPLAGSQFKFERQGKNGLYVSELFPYMGKIVDDLCIVRSMHTEAINHDPAITFFQTGSQQPGRPSMGSWVSYGLGSENSDLPGFCVLLSRGTGRPQGQPLYSRLWGNGFLHSIHQGVQFRDGKDPVLYLNDPNGMHRSSRREMLNALAELNKHSLSSLGDPEIEARIAQYEMAYRMQTSVPETMDISDEPDSTFRLYGADARVPGTYAANCLLARKLIEKDVRFVQLYHMGWDQHFDLPYQIKGQAKDVDQASAALIMDLKQRGLLEDTLVIWGGEFGRTSYSQGVLTNTNYGRDHHPRCFTIWMAGGGVKPGLVYGKTDDFGYNITENPVHVHDLQATILHLLGIDHEKFTFKSQGRRFRLTDVHGNVMHDLLA